MCVDCCQATDIKEHEEYHITPKQTVKHYFAKIALFLVKNVHFLGQLCKNLHNHLAMLTCIENGDTHVRVGLSDNIFPMPLRG